MRGRAPRHRLRGRATRKLLLNRSRGRLVCEYCRKSVAQDRVVGDHAIPLVRGGPDRMDNIVVACDECDRLKGPLTADEFRSVMGDHPARKALIARVHAELAANPVKRRAADRRRSK